MINPINSKIAHGFIFAPKPFLLTFKFAISLYLMCNSIQISHKILKKSTPTPKICRVSGATQYL